jgi:steroid 5-alpha reductase family enzyme
VFHLPQSIVGQSVFAGALLVGVVMTALWARQLATRNATAVDVAWTANLGLLALLYAWLGGGWGPRRIALATAVGAWSLRLAWHLYDDRVRGEDREDGRYRELRAKWGASAPRNFLFFYWAQGALDLLLAVPFLLMAQNATAEFSTLEFVAAALFVLSLAGESLADRQLAAFRAEPANRGRTCRVGLWRLSRHPNYFFEWLQWCAFALAASAAPWGGLAVGAPLLMLFLILKVTGIPPTEAQALRSRGDDYRRYQRTTSAFVPWFPRSEAST